MYSHSEKNKKIVEHFVKEILLGNFGNDDEFYCTSISGMKNSPGDNWKTKLAKNIKDSKIFLAIVSEEYKKSEICQNELGAAWISKKNIIPLLVKPITYKKMGYLLNESHAAKIDDNKDLDRLKDRFQKILKSKNIKSDKWTESKDEFLKKVKKIIKKRLD